MNEQKPLHTYLYSFCTGDTPNLFVFLWSGFPYLGLYDWTWRVQGSEEGGGKTESREQRKIETVDIGQRICEVHLSTLNLCAQ